MTTGWVRRGVASTWEYRWIKDEKVQKIFFKEIREGENKERWDSQTENEALWISAENDSIFLFIFWRLPQPQTSFYILSTNLLNSSNIIFHLYLI